MAARWPIWGGSAWRRCRRRSRWGSWPRRWRRGRGGWNWWSRGSITEERSLHHCCNLAEHQKLLALNLTSPHYIFTAEELVTVDEHSGNVTKEKENFFLLFCNIRYHLGMLQRRKTTTTQTRIEARFNSFLAEPLDLFWESLKYWSLKKNIFMVLS